MKVAIFENEFEELKRAFEGFNLLYYNSSIEYKVFPSSQAIGNLDSLEGYEYVLIDIDLSLNSQQDGFQLLESMLKEPLLKKVKPIILTGQPPIREKLKQKNLPELPIISKPFSFNQIQACFQQAKSIEEYKS
jgi:DNA-binding NtrC family response regulator